MLSYFEGFPGGNEREMEPLSGYERDEDVCLSDDLGMRWNSETK